MSILAVCNMKGGVGKTTTAVNLSYLAAASGRRTLLWDLDPQAASSFTLRVRPRVKGFGRQSLEDGRSFRDAIRETDYRNLDLLPGDFAYRKIDRFLDRTSRPVRVFSALLDDVGRDYELLVLDCPPGFSLLTEGVFAAADAVLVPAIPTVLSLRTAARLIKRAAREESQADLLVFFNMLDRRKSLHRRARDWASSYPTVFLGTHVPYASLVEQMGVRRQPLASFARRDEATAAFATLWTEMQARLEPPGDADARGRASWTECLEAIDTLISRLERADAEDHDPAFRRSRHLHRNQSGPAIVHRFDTASRDLERRGYAVELHEGGSRLLVVATRTAPALPPNAGDRVEARIDGSWALQILSGVLSPLAALERRMRDDQPAILDDIRTILTGRQLSRVASATTESDARRAMSSDRVVPFPPNAAITHHRRVG